MIWLNNFIQTQSPFYRNISTVLRDDWNLIRKNNETKT